MESYEQEPLAKRSKMVDSESEYPKLEDSFLKSVHRVKLTFNFGYIRTVFSCGDVSDMYFDLKTNKIHYLDVDFVKVEEVSTCPNHYGEREKQRMKPFGGIRIDFYKDNTIKRIDYIRFTDMYICLEGLFRYDCMRIALAQHCEFITKEYNRLQYIDIIGEDDDEYYSEIAKSRIGFDC